MLLNGLMQPQAPVRRPGKVIPRSKAAGKLLTARIHKEQLNRKGGCVKPANDQDGPDGADEWVSEPDSPALTLRDKLPRMSFMFGILLLAIVLAPAAGIAAGKDLIHNFKKVRLTQEFWAEGANFGDFNHDGKMDVVAGPFWYEGPDFKKRHEFYPANTTFKRKKSDGTEETLPGYEGALGVENVYSENFLAFTYDFNGDGWADIMVYGFPGKEASWYENPKGREGHWQRHVVFDVLDNESPAFVDVIGEGKPQILCCSGGYIGYATADWKNPGAPWKFHAISPKGDYQRFTHGLGSSRKAGGGSSRHRWRMIRCGENTRSRLEKGARKWRYMT